MRMTAAVVRAGFRGGNCALLECDRLVSGIFKNILDIVVKCTLQRIEVRSSEDSVSHEHLLWKYAVIVLLKLVLRYQFMYRVLLVYQYK